MGVPSDAAVPAGDVVRELVQVKSDVAQARTARRGEATSVGTGGMRFHSGGSATFEGGGGVIVRDGGDIGVAEGGRLYATYPSGNEAVKFGHLIFVETGEDSGYGLLVQTDSDDPLERQDIFRARLHDGERRVIIGQTPAPAGAVESFASHTLAQSHYTYGGTYLIQSTDDGDVNILSDNRLWLFADGNLDADVNGNLDADVGGNLDIDAQGTALIQSNTTMQLLCEGQAGLGGTTGTFLTPESGVGTANMRIDTTTGRVTYVASTARVKVDIQDLDVDPSVVLRLRPRSWMPGPTTRQCPEWMHANHKDESDCSAGQIVDPPEGSVREVGFVAEELDAIGLGDFVEYDADARPASIRYDRLTAALVPLLQQQQAQIDALTQRLDALDTPTTGQEA